jgi:hypothetical protein
MRPDRPGGPEVEWDTGDPGRDELLAEPDGPRWFGTPRRRRAGAALVVVAAAALVGVRLVTAHRASPEAKPPPATTPAASVRVGPSPVDVTPGRPNFEDHDPAHCPATITCNSGTAVPPGVLTAIRRYVPNAELFDATNVAQVHPDRLYFRQVLASAKDIELLVLVARADRMSDPPTEEAADPPGESIRYVRTETADGFVVQVQFNGPPAKSTLGLAQVRSLARDPRLRSLG